MDFAHRSPLAELLDDPGVPFDDIRQNMKELAVINRLLGGHAVTREGMKALTTNARHSRNARLSICEIGCGGGDNLQAVSKWAARRSIPVTLTGIDINPSCIASASDTWSGSTGTRVEFISSDYRAADLGNTKPDIIFCSLFCHHFSDQEVVKMLQWMRDNSKNGFFINDLHRHRLAYHAIGWLTKIFSRSYLVRHDAPLSVLRGFRRKEWEYLCSEAGLPGVRIRWRWAFRWLIEYKHAAETL